MAKPRPPPPPAAPRSTAPSPTPPTPMEDALIRSSASGAVIVPPPPADTGDADGDLDAPADAELGAEEPTEPALPVPVAAPEPAAAPAGRVRLRGPRILFEGFRWEPIPAAVDAFHHCSVIRPDVREQALTFPSPEAARVAWVAVRGGQGHWAVAKASIPADAVWCEG